MAIIQTELTREAIHPDELARIPEGGVPRESSVPMLRKGDWIGFNGDEPFLGGHANFGRSIGLNVQTGTLHVGNIQFPEAPLRKRLGDDQDYHPPLGHEGRITNRNPIIMELERLAHNQIGAIELVDMENDGTPNGMYDTDKQEFDAWKVQYLAAVAASKTGKPRIEAFYHQNRKKEEQLLSSVSMSDLRIIFGDRIHEIMRTIRLAR